LRHVKIPCGRSFIIIRAFWIRLYELC
jgi:hypothetical protein